MIFKTKHLTETKESYWAHFKFGIIHGFYLIKMGLMSIVHSFFPDIYPFELPRMVIGLHEKIKKKHGTKLLNKLTQEVRENKNNDY